MIKRNSGRGSRRSGKRSALRRRGTTTVRRDAEPDPYVLEPRGALKQTRIFVLGDPHIHPEQTVDTAEALEDIARLKPDVVLVLGDLSAYGAGVGSEEWTAHAVQLLDELPCPWYSTIGNHDLEGTEFQQDDHSLAMLLRCLKRPTPWMALDLGVKGSNRRVAFVLPASEMFRGNPYQMHEVFFGQVQMDWLARQLDGFAQQPTVMLTHAPIIAAPIRVMPEVHLRATNAYCNQNHDPQNLARIWARHPQIGLWLSGHSHLGQEHPDSAAVLGPTLFAHVGVHRRQIARETGRHSRVIDFLPDENDVKVELLTFDHTKRDFIPELRKTMPRLGLWGRSSAVLYEANGAQDPGTSRPCYSFPAPVKAATGGAPGSGISPASAPAVSPSAAGSSPAVTLTPTIGLSTLPITAVLPYHDGAATALALTDAGGVFVATQGGSIWEYGVGQRVATGTLGKFDPLSNLPFTALALDSFSTPRFLWASNAAGAIWRIDLADPRRFVRYPSDEPVNGQRFAAPGPVQKLFAVGLDRCLAQLGVDDYLELPEGKRHRVVGGEKELRVRFPQMPLGSVQVVTDQSSLRLLNRHGLMLERAAPTGGRFGVCAGVGEVACVAVSYDPRAAGSPAGPQSGVPPHLAHAVWVLSVDHGLSWEIRSWLPPLRGSDKPPRLSSDIDCPPGATVHIGGPVADKGCWLVPIRLSRRQGTDGPRILSLRGTSESEP
ncbi:MAG TPA: metallophosphoesterase [Planctomycetota bacterium]|nr:metallophosphoesterase [Planctomycetota bacterium]